jgi:hypothetical protein
LHSISDSLRPGAAPPLASAAAPPGSTSGAASSRCGARSAAAAARTLFPEGCRCSAASPEAFYWVREALAGAVKAAAVAFKPTHAGLAKALKGALDELEETGLFD